MDGSGKDISVLPQTRSGRRIIPPLSHWTNQRLIANGDVTEIVVGSPDYMDMHMVSDRWPLVFGTTSFLKITLDCYFGPLGFLVSKLGGWQF